VKIIADLGLAGTERVLDLGCGDGSLTAQIADLLPAGEVVGIDGSQGMIEAAHAHARPNLRFLLMDIDQLDFTEPFDLVFSNATLHWVKDHRRLYENVARILRDGGQVRFNFAGEGNCMTFFRVAQEAMALEPFTIGFDGFEWPWYMPSVEDYSRLVESSALPNAHVWGENKDRFFPSVDAMIAWVDQPSIVPFLRCLPQQLQAPFRNFVVSRMVQQTRQQNGTCFETFRRINVSAAK